MDGDIDRADPQVNNPLCLPFREIGEGNVIAHKEAQPCVVVLEVEGVPTAGGHLVHKAEQTVVAAWSGFIHQIGVEIQAQLLCITLFYLYSALHTVGVLQYQNRVRVVTKKAVIEHILYRVAVDREQLFPCPDPGPFRRRAFVYTVYDGTHTTSCRGYGIIVKVYCKLPRISI